MSDTADPQPDQTADRPDRGDLLAAGLTATATWSLRALLVAAGVVLLGVVVGQLWVVVLPVLLAVLLTTVMAPVSDFLHRRGMPRSAAAAITVLTAILLLVAVLTLIVRSAVGQAEEIATQASGGLTAVQDWLTGPPLSLGEDQIDTAVSTIVDQLQSSASAIATGVFSGVSGAGSVVVTGVLVLLLSFYFTKDGHRFLPYVHRTLGRRAGAHASATLGRSWTVLGAFVRTQAAVGLVDGVLIGVGLAVLGVPLALPLATLTFLFSFVPIIGAVVAGVLAVLVALVTNGFTTALLVAGLVLLVQQLEGNVLQPILQGRSLRLHPALVLLGVTGGGSLFGIIGAFLAVPVVAVAAEVLRYVSEQLNERAADADVVTRDDPEGSPGARKDGDEQDGDEQDGDAQDGDAQDGAAAP